MLAKVEVEMLLHSEVEWNIPMVNKAMMTMGAFLQSFSIVVV
jgi:hypothetical protein